VAKHRRQRNAAQLKRKQGKRPPYPRVLIVCEGSKTEPLYFEDIRKANQVPSAHIRVTHADGTQPRQIVDHAVRLFKATPEYEWVFAVFDRDDHATYHDALAQAGRLDSTLKTSNGDKARFVAVPSVPCFELWFLLHFRDIRAAHHRDDLFRFMREHCPGYQKGLGGLYALTSPTLTEATKRARWLQQRFTPHCGRDPYTNADQVVSLLLSIKRPDR